ncbi:hypothetical protein PC9H_002382 [Pleurotus ostreatus]|uniref:Protein kinase domain-containing protein n=1 Tax=Pleurotus ostreatus TaxID=5322 RepID=A0A8H6ZNE3_PLEOS|nr:uncharacterized protein PC9H_002382 [Pleurotus ostreatus]KAF7416122.1 hypothetical protein PC9H_002382 [Pleurotus ostreatus]
MPKPDSEKEERKRVIGHTWLRNPDGGPLPRPPPNGKRTPNGLIWASSVDRIYRIQRFPNINVMTGWSISMVAEFNENYWEVADEIYPEPDPQRVLSYPLLNLPVEICQPDGTIWYSARRSIQGATRGLLPAIPRDVEVATSPFGNSFDAKYKLEELIPASFFPDILTVNDPQGATEGKIAKEGAPDLEPTPRKYKRVWPVVHPDASGESSDGDKISFLNLAGAPLLGRGNHSVVHRGALRLPSGIEANTPDGSAAVAVKMGFPTRGARSLLAHEAGVYNQIYGEANNVGFDSTEVNHEVDEGGRQRHLMEHWTGVNLLTPDITHPVPVGAVVPKFFGYYVPTDEAEAATKCAATRAKLTKEGKSDGGYWKYSSYDEEELNLPPETILSPILLLEDCGKPIKPQKMNIDDRTECLSFLVRLYLEDISHSSFYPRNIMVQPGPLTKAPKDRTMQHPSFRLIDLGRADHWKMHTKREVEEYKRKHGKDLPEERLQIGPDGYIRDDVDYTPEQREWKTIALKWAQAKQREISRAREQLLMEMWG